MHGCGEAREPIRGSRRILSPEGGRVGTRSLMSATTAIQPLLIPVVTVSTMIKRDEGESRMPTAGRVSAVKDPRFSSPSRTEEGSSG